MKKIFKLIICLWMLTFFFSCNKRSEINHPPFNEDLIHAISEGLLLNPAYYMLVDMVFVEGENNKKIKLHPRELLEIYKGENIKMNYEEYIRKALNQKIKFDTKDKGYAFELDSLVSQNYQNNNFKDFLELYCEFREEGRYISKLKMPENKITENSIFYYAFINNYLTVFDDYLGRYYIYDISLYFNEKK